MWFETESYFANANHLPTPCIFFFFVCMYLKSVYVTCVLFCVDTVFLLICFLGRLWNSEHKRCNWVLSAVKRFDEGVLHFLCFVLRFIPPPPFLPPSTYNFCNLQKSSPVLKLNTWAVEVSAVRSGVFDVVCHYQIAARRVLWSFNICYMWTKH